VGSRRVYVKRDDLFANPPAPPLAKLRGLRVMLARLQSNGVSRVGCFEASASRIGHGLAATACTLFPDLKCIVAYPKVRNQVVPASALAAESLGATLLAVPSNFVSICYRQAAKHVVAQGGYMIPFGFECEEAVSSVEREARTVPIDMVENGTLVVSCGSGVTLAGLLRGLRGRPNRIVGVSAGRSVRNVLDCVMRCGGDLATGLEIRAPAHLYRHALSTDCPFPCDAHYDLKAWDVLMREIDSFRDPILFWNVGGSN
jgi:1-aminocyclopropane-1-carboxylate deaminase/D-cysteine desulfhydrase-like pyridoxal-dependent ACC family enzyme